MNRLLPALGLAVAAHVALLAGHWALPRQPVVRPARRTIALRLLRRPAVTPPESRSAAEPSAPRPQPKPVARAQSVRQPVVSKVIRADTPYKKRVQPPSFPEPVRRPLEPAASPPPPVDRQPSPAVVDQPVARAVEEKKEPVEAESVAAAFSVPAMSAPVATGEMAANEEVSPVAPPRRSKARPLYQQNRPPVYPRRARRRGYQGTVVLAVLVRADGRVATCEIAVSSGYAILDRAAAQAVRGWRFIPGQENGRPVAMRVRVPVRFALRNP